jgi:hypothetical protein
MRRTLFCLVVAPVATAVLPASAWAERPPYQLEVGPVVGLAVRGTKQNPDKIAYEPAVLYGLQFRLRLTSWLRASARYHTAHHVIDLPPYSLGTGATHIDADPAKTHSLALFFHPTWNVTDRLHVMGAFGVGWTKIDVPPLELDPPNGANVRNRGGVLVETPVGISASFDIVHGWMSAGYDGTYSPAFLQTGGMYQADPYVNRAGYSAEAAAMPRISYTITNLVWLAVNL